MLLVLNMDLVELRMLQLLLPQTQELKSGSCIIMKNLFLFTLAFANHLFELGREHCLEAFGRPLPRGVGDIFEAYAALPFGEDRPVHLFRRKRHLLFVAERLPTRLRQLARFFSPDQLTDFGRLLLGHEYRDEKPLKKHEAPGT